MRERDMQSKFTKWLKTNGHTAAYELKLCKKKSMPFNVVQEHQINALIKAKCGRIVHKISDFSPGMKPFDCFCMERESAYVVVGFWEMRNLRVYIIDIDDFLMVKSLSARKSLTEEGANKIGTKINI